MPPKQEVTLQLQQLPLFCSQTLPRVLTPSVTAEKRSLKGPYLTSEQTLHRELEKRAAWSSLVPKVPCSWDLPAIVQLLWGHTWTGKYWRGEMDLLPSRRCYSGETPKDRAEIKTSRWNDKAHQIHRYKQTTSGETSTGKENRWIETSPWFFLQSVVATDIIFFKKKPCQSPTGHNNDF